MLTAVFAAYATTISATTLDSNVLPTEARARGGVGLGSGCTRTARARGSGCTLAGRVPRWGCTVPRWG